MNVVMLWLRVAAWLVVWLCIIGWLLGRFWSSALRWMAGGSGGCGTSVGEGTARGRQAAGGDTLRPLLGCGAGLLPFAQTRFAQTVRSVAAASLTSLTGSANVTTSSASPRLQIQSERSQRVAH